MLTVCQDSTTVRGKENHYGFTEVKGKRVSKEKVTIIKVIGKGLQVCYHLWVGNPSIGQILFQHKMMTGNVSKDETWSEVTLLAITCLL